WARLSLGVLAYAVCATAFVYARLAAFQDGDNARQQLDKLRMQVDVLQEKEAASLVKGRWLVTEIRWGIEKVPLDEKHDITLSFDDGKFTATVANSNVRAEGTYTARTAREPEEPKPMDLNVTLASPGGHLRFLTKARRYVAIYELDGNRLRLLVGEE